jgi:hypothetical protein
MQIYPAYPAANQLLNQVMPAQKTYVIGHEPEVLTQIYDTQINMCILKRSIDPAIRRYAMYLQQEYVDFQLTRQVSVQSLADVLEESLPVHSMSTCFIEDVVIVVDMFSCLLSCVIIVRIHAISGLTIE